MIENLYAKYLLADRLAKIAESVGVRIHHIKFDNGSKSFERDVAIQCGLKDDFSPEGNEKAAELILEAMPGTHPRRDGGLVYVEGVTYLGLMFHFYVGQGVCERVQVGTRIVPAVPAQPEHEVPVFEVICSDPLRELVKA